MPNKHKDSKLIRINKETYYELCKCGTLADTFDSVLKKLLSQSSLNKRVA